MFRAGGPSKGGGMAARLGVKGGVKGGQVVGDARQKIIQANRVKTGDAR